MKIRLAVVISAIGLCLLAPGAWAKGKQSASTDPGKYTDWKGEIDQLEILHTFKAADYTKVVIEPFDTKGTPLPEETDNTFKPVKAVLASASRAFADGLREDGPASLKISEGEGSKAAGTLIFRAKVVEMDPGSRAARYWAGFGAGAARAKLQGELVDAKSGKVLLKFEQERRSGVGAAGGDYESLMNRNLRAIGKDVALILNTF